MKVGKILFRTGAAVAVAFLIGLTPANGGGPNLAMLDTIDSGAWELRVREPGGAPQRMCIDNGRKFIQLRHQTDYCDRFVVEDSASDVTVQYTCRGRGYGRTHIRRETNRLLQIDSQGIARGLPFEFTAEARRVGDCGS
ncbi:MAG: hypothetical protein JSR28_10880 [Proteobacteria bacterium]|nr:hypothetical protein [Pseudomonadota bacterium]